MPDLVFSIRSLQRTIERFEGLESLARTEWAERAGIAQGKLGEVLYLVDPLDEADCARIVLMSDSKFSSLPLQSMRATLERVHRVALEAEQPPVSLPWGWNSFSHENLVAFFAGPRSEGDLRWIAEVHPLGSRDVCFWTTYWSSDPIFLDQFSPDYASYVEAAAGWAPVLSKLSNVLASLRDVQRASVESAVDLDAASFGAVVGHRTYSTWLPGLTPQQQEFLDASTEVPIKLRGAAGTGKTLALELKVLKELYSAQDSGRPIRILFATHSWAMAEQVDAGLRALDERGNLSGVDVFPLLTVATEMLPSGRGGFGYDLLGEDSLSGKREQFDLIGKILSKVRQGDWLAFKSRTSHALAERIESEVGSRKFNSLVWDLMGEFTTVLSANGILPGVNARRQYLALNRTPWMMPLDEEGDKIFVLRVYTEYVESLSTRRLLTSDQFINDFLNYLETFAWNIRREAEGYDLIFVDELHLFGEQERLVLHYLTRSPNEYPRMFMALDPRQSPAELYADIGRESIVRGESGMADAFLGTLRSVELSAVHRFTPEILRLVRHINNSYPALGLGEDWELDLTDVPTSVASGVVPTLYEHADFEAERASLLQRADALMRDRPSSARVAILLLEPLALSSFLEGFDGAGAASVYTVIRGRDDVASLQYRRRSVVVSSPEYVGGLQFDSILLGGLGGGPSGLANLGHQRRRFLALLYLGLSRASQHVEIHVNDADGGIPEVLSSAIGLGALSQVS